MKLWRPKDRTEWWFAFAGAVLVLAPITSLLSLASAQVLNAEHLIWVGRIAVAIPAAYLILISHLGPAWKAVLLPVVSAIVIATNIPRSSCGDEDPPVPTAKVTETTSCRN